MPPNFPGLGSPLMGGPLPGTPPQQPGQPLRKSKLWRSQTYRLALANGGVITNGTVLAASRYLVGALQLFADIENANSIYIGNRELGLDSGGFALNSYFCLDPGRSAYIWTDNEEFEFIDVSQYYALFADASGTAHLHVTPYTAQIL